MPVVTALELRDLATAIERACMDSPIASCAMPIVRNCVDHLHLLARLHEINAMQPNPPGYGD